MWIWTLFTAPDIAQYIHSVLVIEMTNVLHTKAFCSIHMYCMSCCTEALQGPGSRVSFYSFCNVLCLLSFFLSFVLPLLLYLFKILCFFFISPFSPFFLPSFPYYSFPYSFLLSCLYLFPPFLRLYIFLRLFLSRSLLSPIPEHLSSITLWIHHLSIHHPSFFLPFSLQSFLSHFLSFLPLSFLS